jgi:hypothetical protein
VCSQYIEVAQYCWTLRDAIMINVRQNLGHVRLEDKDQVIKGCVWKFEF